MARAMSAKQIISLRRETIDLGGVWKDCVGAMDRRCVVFVWGNSGNGKTSAVMSLCRELCAKGLRGIYLSLEEGFSVSMQDTLRRFGMEECGSLFKVAESCSMAELTDRLARRRSEDFFVIDSIQYLRLTYRQYVFIKNNWPNKLFILVSHADGRQPEGQVSQEHHVRLRSQDLGGGLRGLQQGALHRIHRQGRDLGEGRKGLLGRGHGQAARRRERQPIEKS